MGLYYAQMTYFAEAKEAVDPIIALALSADYKRRLSHIYYISGIYHALVEEDHSKALEDMEKASAIAEDQKDMISSVLTNYGFSVISTVTCDFEKAASHLQRALDINIAANSLWGAAVMKANQAYFCYNQQGRVNLAYQTSEQAIQIAETSEDILSKRTAYSCHAGSIYHNH
ncbi:hypothetical protein ACFL0Q_06835 [Thermodesulfobacteriota bacterium]